MIEDFFENHLLESRLPSHFKKQFLLKRFFLGFSLLTFTISAFSETAPQKNNYLLPTTLSLASLGLTLGLNFVPTKTCAWCQSNAFDENISLALIATQPKTPRIFSDIFLYGLSPALAFSAAAFSAKNQSQILENSLIIFTSAALCLSLTQIIKISARRQRPEAYYGGSSFEQDRNRSFLSGHTSLSFALLSAATLLSFKNEAKFAPYFAGLAALTASTTGLLRIVAAKHWTTDVLAGMTLGIGMGTITSFLLLPKNNSDEPNNFSLWPDLKNKGLLMAFSW